MSEGLLALGIEDLGLELSSTNIADLELFLQEMGRWNQVHNLTAIEGEKDSIRLHLIDSIAIVQSEWQISLIEAIRKKTAFLQHVRGKLKLKNIEVLCERVEDAALQQPAQFDAVISRAFTNLARFLELSLPFLKPDGLVFAMKAKRADEEMQDVCMEDWQLVADEPLHIPNLAVERRLLVLTPVRKSPLTS